MRPDGDVELDVQAVPRASRDAVGKVHGDRLKIHVKAPPVDGEANEALLRLLRKVLGVGREDLELLRGQTGKRKTVKICGLGREVILAKLGLELPTNSNAGSGSGSGASSPSALLASLLTLSASVGPAACTEARELPITVLLPADTSDLERADNASLILRPGGDPYTFAVDGTSFTLELEGEPSTTLQQLELYLAEGDSLLAWGSTPSFATAASVEEDALALFLARPGRLSTWPEALETPDPDLLATVAAGRGMLLVESDGDTYLLNHFTLELETGARLPDSVDFGVEDGGLFTASDGGVIRLAYEDLAPQAWRYEPSDDTWTELSVDGSDEIGPLPGAAVLVDPDQTRIYLLGGGEHTDAVAIDLLVDDEGTLAAAPVADFALDRPRPGAVALWLPSADDPIADALIVGGGEADSTGAPAVLASTGEGFGEDLGLLTGHACALLRGPSLDEPGADEQSRVLCVGGTLDDLSSDAGLFLDPASAQTSLVSGFLPVAMADPLLLADDLALYAQGESRWFRIDRSEESVSEPESSALRAHGGHSVSLATGATFLVGGVDGDDTALDRWQVFMPAIDP
nr:DUF167 domain-containing protein [Pseudenhygromyxa sp. WMMC2535]